MPNQKDSNTKSVNVFFESLEKIDSVITWNVRKTLEAFDETEIDSTVRDSVSTERKVLDLYIDDSGDLHSEVGVVDINGNIIDTIIFGESEYAYLTNRISSTRNEYLKARYAHLIWQKTKHNLYAKQSINSYLNILEYHNTNDTRTILKIIYALINISQKSKVNSELVKKTVLQLFEKLDTSKKNLLFQKIVNSNFFKSKEIEYLSIRVEECITENYFLNKNLLNTALKLYSRLKLNKDSIYLLLAKNEDLVIKLHPDESDFLHIISVGEKAIYFKRANAILEHESTLSNYNQLKTKVKLKNISAPIKGVSAYILNKYVQDKSKVLLKLNHEHILDYFAIDQDILPKEVEETQNQSNINDLSDIFTISRFDSNLNYKKVSGEDNLKNTLSIESSISYNLLLYALFCNVIFEGVIQGKIDHQKVIDYFTKKTWFGHKFNMNIGSIEIEDKVTWITLISPALHSFFTQLNLSILTTDDYATNYILFIDSITLKFEGLVRDFIRLAGGYTQIEENGVFREQLLDQLLENKKFTDFFRKKTYHYLSMYLQIVMEDKISGMT